MKTRLIFLLSLLWVLIGCSDSDSSATLQLSASKFDKVSASGESLAIDITCSASWTVTSNKQWCIPHTQKGENDGKLLLTIQANLEAAPRTATVTIISHKVSQTIQITQNSAAGTAEEYHYELPVIFHVFYKDKSDPLQYVSQSRLREILNAVNRLYKDAAESVDMNLTFTLATKGPNNEQLSTPGVEYKEWSGNYPIDCDAFMNDNSGKYVNYLWDPNQYINVMIYNFTSDADSGATTLGISHLPYSTTHNHFLEGLNPTSYTHLEKRNLKYPYCVSINSLFINEQSGTYYSVADVRVTLAHELGHYLGLHHVFSEKESGDLLDGCADTDYCKDTPSYDKIEYDNWLKELPGASYELAYLCQRSNCQNRKFTSTNIMDYSYSYSNQFTQDQRERIRHVLSYSPLIPGPKKRDLDTRALTDGPLDLPIRTVR